MITMKQTKMSNGNSSIDEILIDNKVVATRFNDTDAIDFSCLKDKMNETVQMLTKSDEGLKETIYTLTGYGVNDDGVAFVVLSDYEEEENNVQA